MPDFKYCQGYRDAMFDLFEWVDLHSNVLKTKGLTMKTLLGAFCRYYMRFMKVKSDFDFELNYVKKMKGKKEITEIVLTPSMSEKKEIIIEIGALKSGIEDAQYYLESTGQDLYEIRKKEYQKQIDELEQKLNKMKMLQDILQVSNGDQEDLRKNKS